MGPTIWNIRVLIETDDAAVVDAKIEAIAEAMCGPENSLGPEHRCDPPWFIVSGPMRKKKAKAWRKLLNR